MADNPLAFPRPGFEAPAGYEDGMTLRDWFAGQALAGYCANQEFMANGRRHGRDPDLLVSQAAYEMATAMIAERSK